MRMIVINELELIGERVLSKALENDCKLPFALVEGYFFLICLLVKRKIVKPIQRIKKQLSIG